MPQMLIGLGTNVGDRMSHLRDACMLLSDRFRVLSTSSVYETAPMYVEDQPAFLNAAALVESTCSPLGVLRALKLIETEIGRHTRERYGPREIDLDLLAYGSLAYRYWEAGKTLLQVPHSKTPERRVALAPLADIAPEWELPGLGTVAALLEQTNGQAESVKRIADAVLPLSGDR
jgi:2-amino-4-hydroxy-6-hydroxymethyldihydropteridine diphosphokinase